jgi:hypothetical protein
LGDSTRRSYDPTTWEKKSSGIGTKGHGAKIFYKSKVVEVETYRSNNKTTALVREPLKHFYKGELPEIDIKTTTCNPPDWWRTKIEITGYDALEIDFEHESLKDYIYWFTKHGSPELRFNINGNKGKTISLKGLGKNNLEQLEFGHRFSDEAYDMSKLKREHPQYDFTKYFVKRWAFPSVSLLKHPGHTIDFLFSIEGDEAKRIHNPMLRNQKYTVGERYGVWLCKDYIPIQRVNEWLAKKTEWTKFHSFINCQHLELTANRGSINNTKKELIQDIEDTVKKIFKEEIGEDKFYKKYLDAVKEEEGYRNAEDEKNDYTKRAKKARKKKHTKHKDILLFEPKNEAETISLFNIISALHPELFEFFPVDYNTKSGYDTLVRKKDNLPINQAELKFVEFKYILKSPFNHSFENLNLIVCWDCDLKDGTSSLFDLKNESATLHITKTSDNTEYTLRTDAERTIKVYVLKKIFGRKNWPQVSIINDF